MSLIVLEGLDGSGKGTQFKLLVDFLESQGEKIANVDFPDYNSNSSALVKMYLGGEFGKNPKEINAYASCTFYAVDRFASYTSKWKENYDKGDMIVANRYTSSNIVYQMSKLDKDQWDEFIEWVEDTEYNKFKLPKPDMVIYLDMPTEISQGLMSKRYSGDESKKDIHESDIKFLNECRTSALYAAEKLSWKVINCSKDGNPRSIEDISEEIKELVKGV